VLIVSVVLVFFFVVVELGGVLVVTMVSLPLLEHEARNATAMTARRQGSNCFIG